MDILAFGRDPQNQSKISDQIYRFFLSKSNKYFFAVPEAQHQSISDQIYRSFDSNLMFFLAVPEPQNQSNSDQIC